MMCSLAVTGDNKGTVLIVMVDKILESAPNIPVGKTKNIFSKLEHADVEAHVEFIKQQIKAGFGIRPGSWRSMAT